MATDEKSLAGYVKKECIELSIELIVKLLDEIFVGDNTDPPPNRGGTMKIEYQSEESDDGTFEFRAIRHIRGAY